MNYYAWAGWEEKQLKFLIQEIEELKNSPYKQGDWVVTTGKVIYTNEPYNIPEGEQEVEVNGSSIYDTLEEALKSVIRELFRSKI